MMNYERFIFYCKRFRAFGAFFEIQFSVGLVVGCIFTI
jgi:hypothetical protein